MTDFSLTRTDTTGIRQTTGTATSTVTGSVASFNIQGTTVTVQVARGLTIAVGDVCLIVKVGAQWFVTARLFAAAPVDPGSDDPPPPKPTTVTGKLVVVPVETRSYRNGSWRTDNDDVYQGQFGGNGNHTGCAFYGGKPKSLAGSTVTAASIKVRRKNAGGITAAQSTTLRLVTQTKRPAGAPTLTSSTSGPHLRWGASDNSFDIPTSWAQAMVDGTSGGLAVFDSLGSPYVIFDGRSAYSAAFTMTISWSRTS